MPFSPPIEVRGPLKRYGDTSALDGFDLDVSAGSVHALLGPNGAGKSTAVHTLATLTRIEEGEARVAGFDVRTEHAQVRSAIGLVGLHVVDDNFLQPEPGMGAVDHLPGGLTLLALVATGAWAYTRVRAGARLCSQTGWALAPDARAPVTRLCQRPLRPYRPMTAGSHSLKVKKMNLIKTDY